MTIQSELARLFILGHDNLSAAMSWRWKLIKKEKTVPHKGLLEILKRLSQGSLDQKNKDSLVRTANSEMILDEVFASILERN